MEEVLLACHGVVADLAYLALRNLIVPEPLGYAPPESRGITSVLDVNVLKARFPEFGGMITPIPETLAVPAVIAAVDAVVLVVDYVRAKQ